jgi:large subunit ribosomal protein L22
MMKRMEPRAMGRANMIKKKSSHITIVVSEE